MTEIAEPDWPDWVTGGQDFYYWLHDDGVCFPTERDPVDEDRLWDRQVDVSYELLDKLPLDAIGAYCVLRMWDERGEGSGLDKFARERCDGSSRRASRLIAMLKREDLLWTEQEAAEFALESAKRRHLEQEEQLEQVRRSKVTSPASYEGTVWRGSWPLKEGTEYPGKGASVVYFLYDAADALAYVGSTGAFIRRMEAHAKDKVWVRWEALKCRSRDDAYRLEEAEIADRRPYLNRPTIGRRAG